MIRESFYSSLPFYLLVSHVWFSPFVMIINLLMWANVGTPGDRSGDENGAA